MLKSLCDAFGICPDEGGGPSPGPGLRVVFKTQHAERHLAGTGLGAAEMEGAITADINQNAASLPAEGSFENTITIGGTSIRYRGYVQPNGTVSVGTYFVPGPDYVPRFPDLG